MSDYSTTARQGAGNGRDYGARHPILREAIVLGHGCVLAKGQRAPRAPHRKCRRISGRYFNREKSGPRIPGTKQRRIQPTTSFFSRNSSRIARRLRIGVARWRKRYLDDSRPGAYIALLRPPAHMCSVQYTCSPFTPAVQCSLFAPVRSLAGSL